MLTEQSVLSAVSVANKFSDRNKALIAKPNTLLNRLVDATYIKINGNSVLDDILETQGNGYEILATAVSSLTDGKDSVSIHDEIMADSVDTIATFVNQHISYAKTEVSPKVVEMYNSLAQYTQNYPDNLAETTVNIDEYDIPHILMDESFVDNMKYMDGKKILTPDAIVSIAPKSNEDLLKLLLTGDERYDEQILPWASKLKNPQSIFNSFFNASALTPELASRIISADRLMSEPIYNRLDTALAIYLISVNLYNNPENTEGGITLAKYKDLLSQMKDFAAGLIWESLQRISLFRKNNTLILGVDGKCAIVYKPIYEAWLSTGGSPETVLGVVVSGRPIYLQGALDANSDDLKKSWNSYKTFYNASQVNTRIDRFKEYLTILFDKYLGEPGNLVTQYKEAHPGYDENARKLFEEYKSTLVVADMSSLSVVALKTVAYCMHYFTDAYDILKSIEDNCAANKNLDIRESALLATIEYVTRYIMAQIAVE